MVRIVWLESGVYRLGLSRRGCGGGRATGLDLRVGIAALQAPAQAEPLRSRTMRQFALAGRGDCDGVCLVRDFTETIHELERVGRAERQVGEAVEIVANLALKRAREHDRVAALLAAAACP